MSFGGLPPGVVKAPVPPLLKLPTGELCQPVRLCYTLQDLVAARTALSELGCIREDRSDDDVMRWYTDHEAVALPIGDVPAARSFLLGRFRFPDPLDFKGMLVLETLSVERALAAARFFAPRLPQDCRPARCRVVVGHFSAESGGARGGTERLMEVLDMDVVVNDRRPEDARMYRELAHAKGPEEAARTLAARLRSLLGQSKSISIEDFALVPEETVPPFAALAQTLGLRALKAWRVSGDVTDEQLAAGIKRLAGGELP